MSYFTMASTEPPAQSTKIHGHSTLTDHYAVIPPTVITDWVSSRIPFWDGMTCWVLAGPSSGHHTRFAQYLVHLDPGGGSDRPEPQPEIEDFVFVLSGELTLVHAQETHRLADGGFAFLPAGADWRVRAGADGARFLWLRKRYEEYGGPAPVAIVDNENDVPVLRDDDVPPSWTTPLIPLGDLRYDLNINIVSFAPGACIPFAETHVMEHGLYMLQGRGMYLLNQDWHEVGPGAFIWMRSFCPQAFIASGDEPARYLLYKDVNRQLML